MIEWILGLAKYIFREWIMYFPWHKLRLFFIRKVVDNVGKNTFIAMKVDIKGSKGNLSIGNNCVINKLVTLDARGGKLTIGNNVDIGQETNIWTESHNPHDNNHDVNGGDITIEDYVWIATRVTILPNIKIGRGAVIATGSIVTKDVESMSIVAGNPAKKIGVRNNELTYKLKYNPWFM